MFRFRAGLVCLAAAATLLGARAAAVSPSPFDEAERTIVSSPGSAAEYAVPPGERVVDLESSPGGGEVAVLLGSQRGTASRLLVWKPGTAPSEIWRPPAGVSVKSMTWHPEVRALFVLSVSGNESRILRLEPGNPAWTAKVIHRSKAALRRLVAGPRPFIVELQPEPKWKVERRYRLFFGRATLNGKWAIHTVSELGEAEYEVIGPEKATPERARKEGDGGPSGETDVRSALPLGFHPGGHLLLWEDGERSFHSKLYLEDAWGASKLLWGGAVSGGTVTALPNGLGVLHWKPGTPGAVAMFRGGKERVPLAAAWTFTSTPSLMPDGKGIVGVTRSGAEGPGGSETLRFVPAAMPLADVVDAWMFAEGSDDLSLLDAKGGLFRRVGGEQLYEFYDSEMYRCGGYSSTTPTRPYLVTTDVLWEVWAAAYEGLFILRERESAIPAFWALVDAAADELARTDPASSWAKLFAAARASREKGTRDEEAGRIRAHAGTAFSTALGEPFDYAELTPRGHYAGKPAAAGYFAAMRYLTAAGAKVEDASPLGRLPAGVRAKAAAWIAVYEPFLAPPRAPEALRPSSPPRSWVREPVTRPALFPLSWGFDNETLYSTVFHPAWPAAEQVRGAAGPRLVPSGLDVAAAFGSRLARTLLQAEVAKYPPLGGALDRLAARRPAPGKGPSLYERWLEALGDQWADEALANADAGTREVWGVKRLQTGLASWATLRHATVLVNERSAAECGEAGFEELVMRPPRGHVEADPGTFEAIASLFDAARTLVESSPVLAGNVPEDDPNGTRRPEPLREGLLRRLREAAARARGFGTMAAKELRGEPLTAKEYEEILTVARAAEHDFLVFKSLASPVLALSHPDPMPKVVDVAGGGGVPLLLAAVGSPLEFDLAVPFFGRRQVVKGAVYGYHELSSLAPMSDEEWRRRAGREPLAAWAEPFVVKTLLTCPPKSPF